MEVPTISKVIDDGATILFYYYEINILSMFKLKQSDLPEEENSKQGDQVYVYF